MYSGEYAIGITALASGGLAWDTSGVSTKPRKRLRCPIDVFRYHDYRAFLAAYYEHKKP
ncbi:MAG: hypothetical protein RL033_1963, partial [Pseudomonadota bacterium]